MIGPIAADPYPWSYDGDLRPANTALIVIDMQTDFCGPGGYVDEMGYDLGLTRVPIGPIQAVLAAMRGKGYRIFHAREGHRPDLADLPANKRWRSRRIGAGIGDPGPCGRILVHGEPGWRIIPELAPEPGEPIIDKPGKGSFCATDLELMLRTRGIANLVLAGITTDVRIHTTMREANDRGFDSLPAEDATESYFAAFKRTTLEMIRTQRAIVGWTAPVDRILAALHGCARAFRSAGRRRLARAGVRAVPRRRGDLPAGRGRTGRGGAALRRRRPRAAPPAHRAGDGAGARRRAERRARSSCRRDAGAEYRGLGPRGLVR